MLSENILFYAKIFTYYASPLTHYARIMLDLKLKKQMLYQLRSTQKIKKQPTPDLFAKVQYTYSRKM